ncbi:MAG TPA: hypothetical protein VHU85_02695 [Acidimicrobiales bacterium]|jgi:hypothetical protein|nr:hypothetical protein [Acidimicrobiales bacterium]
MAERGDPGLVDRYLTLGLRLGRHIDGMVDAYYGPPARAQAADREPMQPPDRLVAEARRLLADIDAGGALDGSSEGVAGAAADGSAPARRRWLRAQVIGLMTTARKLAGEDIGYADEVEACYGIRPSRVDESTFAAAHARLDEVLPGNGPLAERLVSWRESHAVPTDSLRRAIDSLAEDFRDRTKTLFGLPEGEGVEFELVNNEPWSGFNYYLGDLQSRVAVNTDLPVLSTSLAHLVAHESYPGHHTEHTRKEVGLVRQRKWWEESIFLVGTPQCLLAEGLADLGLEVIVGRRPEPVVAEHLRPLGLRYDPEVVAAVSEAGEALGAVRQNAAFRLHEDGADVDTVVDEVARWGLLSTDRAAKAVEFLTHPTWRAYLTCYVEGLPLCRSFVGGDPARFDRLLSEQLIPADLQADPAPVATASAAGGATGTTGPSTAATATG